MRTQTEYREKMSKYIKDPKINLVKDIRLIAQTKDLEEEAKLEHIKATIVGYMVDFEIPCF